MKVSYDEDLANHIGPESCVCGRKVAGEALTGENAGQVLSRERGFASGCRRRQLDRKATRNISISQEMFRPRVVVDPEHAWKLSAREPGGPTFGPWLMPRGRRCESQGSTTAINGRGKSDSFIVPVKLSNKDGSALASAEEVEGRRLAKGNSYQQTRYRTQRREDL